ncbi:hypothetical protein GIW45_10465 [Pseudomonas congelans]|nr:hypothetical protein [Pseudomonas congelans]
MISIADWMSLISVADWMSLISVAEWMSIVPTLRVGMQFVTLCVTRRFCDVRWIGVRLR